MKFARYILTAAALTMIFSSAADAATPSASVATRQSEGATASAQRRRAAALAAEERMTGGGGRGSDLRAIATPRKEPQSFTGFPSGTLPGDTPNNAGGTQPEKPAERVAAEGDPLTFPINEGESIGQGLNRIGIIADHIGCSLVRVSSYRPSSPLEAPYSYYLMQGRRRVARLYFDHQLKLVSFE